MHHLACTDCYPTPMPVLNQIMNAIVVLVSWFLLQVSSLFQISDPNPSVTMLFRLKRLVGTVCLITFVITYV